MVKRSLRWQALKLVPGPVVPGYCIEHHDESRVLVVNHSLVRCTVTQYAVLTHLLQHHGQEVSYEDLIGLFEATALPVPDLFERARKKLIKIIVELREKIEPCGFLVVCTSGYGYMLVSYASSAVDVYPEQVSS